MVKVLRLVAVGIGSHPLPSTGVPIYRKNGCSGGLGTVSDMLCYRSSPRQPLPAYYGRHGIAAVSQPPRLRTMAQNGRRSHRPPSPLPWPLRSPLLDLRGQRTPLEAAAELGQRCTNPSPSSAMASAARGSGRRSGAASGVLPRHGLRRARNRHCAGLRRDREEEEGGSAPRVPGKGRGGGRRAMAEGAAEGAGRRCAPAQGERSEGGWWWGAPVRELELEPGCAPWPELEGRAPAAMPRARRRQGRKEGAVPQEREGELMQARRRRMGGRGGSCRPAAAAAAAMVLRRPPPGSGEGERVEEPQIQPSSTPPSSRPAELAAEGGVWECRRGRRRGRRGEGEGRGPAGKKLWGENGREGAPVVGPWGYKIF
jgi:hypothetical protein